MGGAAAVPYDMVDDAIVAFTPEEDIAHSDEDEAGEEDPPTQVDVRIDWLKFNVWFESYKCRHEEEGQEW